VERHIVGLHDRVQHVVAPDDLGVDVRQHRELDAGRVDVVAESLGVVVADRVELDALSGEV
jgi:hypothetical protein